MKASDNTQLTPGKGIRTPEQGRPAQPSPPDAKPVADPRPIDREADIERSAKTLAAHTLKTVGDMAEADGEAPQTYAGMISVMAAAHRKAAEILDKAALSALLQIGGAR